MIFLNILAIAATIGYLLIGVVTAAVIYQFHLISFKPVNFILLVLAGVFWPIVALILIVICLYSVFTDVG